MGVRFPEGRKLLPFYADPGEKPTFTILPPISLVNFYALLPPTANFFLGALHAPFHTVTSTHTVPTPDRPYRTRPWRPPPRLAEADACTATAAEGLSSHLVLLCIEIDGRLLHRSITRMHAAIVREYLDNAMGD